MDSAPIVPSAQEIAALFAVPDLLLAAIVQDATTQKILMLAWMNQAALLQTINTRKATYWSRSRQEIWIKGATSGHFQEVLSIKLDCDGDALILCVNQTGAACHTGEITCFHRPIELSK